MRLGSQTFRSASFLCALIGVLGAMGAGRAVAATEASTQVATAIRQSGCKQYQSDFDRVVAAHADDPMVRWARQRLTAIDSAADAVLGDLRLHHSAFLDQTLATVERPSAEDEDAPRLIGAAQITENYRAAFSGLSSATALKSADRTILEEYLKVAALTQASFIQSHARACMSDVSVDAPEIIRLAFVLELLTSDQNQDFSAPSPPLPEWMSHPKQLRLLQTFAIESAYPRIAFALAHETSATAPADASTAYVSFLKQQTDALLRTAKYDVALVCLRDAITVARSEKQNGQAIQLSFRAAEVLETADGAQAAADEIARLRSSCAEPGDYARASMLRLKYLHEAGQHDILLAEASADLAEPRCEGYLPQIIFIAWMSARQQGGADVESWKKRFVERFPDHPLAADIYFISATDAVAAADYDQASRLLQFIVYRFPHYKLIDKVQTLEERLASKDKSGGTSTAVLEK